jgi:hypothetical protein
MMEENNNPMPPEAPAPPEPMQKIPAWRRLLMPAGLVAVSGGTVLMITASAPTQVMGATRSSQLEYEQRQELIEQTIADSEQTDESMIRHEAEQNDDIADTSQNLE